MNLGQFTSIIESLTPAGYDFYAAHNRDVYNTQRDIQDTCLLVWPNPYPTLWRSGCRHKLTFSIWLGKMDDIKKSGGIQQHANYSPLELRAGMIDTARELIENINDNEYMRVIRDSMVTFYDSPDGRSVNRQVWLEIPIEVEVNNPPAGFDYDFDFDFEL